MSLLLSARICSTVALLAAVGCGSPKPDSGQAGTPSKGGVETAPAPRASSPLDVVEKVKRDRSALQCAALENACKAFFLKYNGDPINLRVLAVPGLVPNVRPVLDGGEAALLDPWGKEYQFEMIQEVGMRSPKVTTTTPDGTVITSLRWADSSK